MAEVFYDRADLVLEGGGVKGIALAGAVSVLMERGYTFPRVAGTSAGSIVGALVASGMSADRMVEVLRTTSFARFQDTAWIDRIPALGPALSVLFERGIFEGDYFEGFLADLLPDVAETFAGLRLPADPNSTLAADQRYSLVVMAADVSLRRLVRLPWDYRETYGTDPDEESVITAVRASMAIPFFFEPVTKHFFRGEGHERRAVRSTLVDGGMLSNFPVAVFDRTDGRPPRWPTFGIKLSTRPDAERMPSSADNPLSLALAMIATMREFHDGMHIDQPVVRDRTIFVDTFGIKATDFDLSADDTDRLYRSGRESAERFLDEWDFDHYRLTYHDVPTPAGQEPG
jgi:NTE family protein